MAIESPQRPSSVACITNIVSRHRRRDVRSKSNAEHSQRGESVQGARRHHRFVEDRIVIDSFGAEDRSPIGGHAESVITS
jgi:hypothetical protein